jgi:ribonuclease J
MLVHNAELAEKEAGIPRENIFVCDSGDVIEITTEGAKKAGRIQVGGIMYDDSGAIVSEVVLKDRIHMAAEGMFVVVLTVARGSGRLMTSPDIISRGFIYLRDSEELMNMIRQYLKQKVARSFGGKRIDLDVMKKELKDEITHILYDQTRRTPIVIPVINEIGGGGGGQNRQGSSENRTQNAGARHNNERGPRPEPRAFPAPQVPDTEATDTRARQAQDSRPY